MHLVAIELERGGERAQDLGRQGRGVGGLRELGLHQRELVAAEPGQGVAGPDRARDPAGHRAQQLVADRMAERVVDLLEAVEVEEEDRGQATFAAGMGQGLAEPVEQQGAVRQPGQRVVQGQPPDARLGRLALGQVLEHRDLGDDLARRGAHRRGVDGGDAARPVAAFERDLPARSHLAARHRTGERPVEREAAVAPIGGRRRPRRLALTQNLAQMAVVEQDPARGRRDDEHACRQMLQHHLEEGRLAFDLLEQALPLGLGPAAVGEVVHEQAPALVQELERAGLLVQQLLGQAAVQATCRSGGGRSAPGASIGPATGPAADQRRRASRASRRLWPQVSRARPPGPSRSPSPRPASNGTHSASARASRMLLATGCMTNNHS